MTYYIKAYVVETHEEILINQSVHTLCTKAIAKAIFNEISEINFVENRIWDIKNEVLTVRCTYVNLYEKNVVLNSFQYNPLRLIDKNIIPNDVLEATPFLSYFNKELVQTDVISLNSVCAHNEYLIFLDASRWDVSRVTDMNNAFYGCKNLTSVCVSTWDTRNLISTISMFNNCKSLDFIDVSSWNTKMLATISWMFKDCVSLKTIDVKFWNTMNIISAHSAFYNCSSLKSLNLSNWNLKNIKYKSHMLYGLKSIEELSLNNVISTDFCNMITIDKSSVFS